MKPMIPANLNPKFEIQEKCKNRFHVLVTHSIHLRGERRYVNTDEVIMMQTLAEYLQWQEYKPKTITYAELIHDPRVKEVEKTVPKNDDLAQGEQQPAAQDDLGKSESPKKQGRPKKNN